MTDLNLHQTRELFAAADGKSVVRTAINRAVDHARLDAFIDDNLKVSIDQSYVIERVLEDPELKSELRTILYKAFPAIKEQVSCDVRQQAALDIDHERKLARA